MKGGALLGAGVGAGLSLLFVWHFCWDGMRPPLNDSLLHLILVQRSKQVLEDAAAPWWHVFDHWLALGCGFPVFLHYQHWPHVGVAVAAHLTGHEIASTFDIASAVGVLNAPSYAMAKDGLASCCAVFEPRCQLIRRLTATWRIVALHPARRHHLARRRGTRRGLADCPPAAIDRAGDSRRGGRGTRQGSLGARKRQHSAGRRLRRLLPARLRPRNARGSRRRHSLRRGPTRSRSSQSSKRQAWSLEASASKYTCKIVASILKRASIAVASFGLEI